MHVCQRRLGRHQHRRRDRAGSVDHKQDVICMQPSQRFGLFLGRSRLRPSPRRHPPGFGMVVGEEIFVLPQVNAALSSSDLCCHFAISPQRLSAQVLGSDRRCHDLRVRACQKEIPGAPEASTAVLPGPLEALSAIFCRCGEGFSTSSLPRIRRHARTCPRTKRCGSARHAWIRLGTHVSVSSSVRPSIVSAARGRVEL